MGMKFSRQPALLSHFGTQPLPPAAPNRFPVFPQVVNIGPHTNRHNSNPFMRLRPNLCSPLEGGVSARAVPRLSSRPQWRDLSASPATHYSPLATHYPIFLCTLLHFLATLQIPTPFLSISSALLLQNTRGGVSPSKDAARRGRRYMGGDVAGRKKKHGSEDPSRHGRLRGRGRGRMVAAVESRN